MENNKKAQEEVFGFVIIVLIVMVIGLVFFALALRPKSEIIEPKQAELDDLLQAMLSYTTECKIAGSPQNIRELPRECNNNRFCDNNINTCDFLETELDTMLEGFLEESIADAYIHGYIMNISNTKEIFYRENGQLEGNYFGSSVPLPTLTGEDIIVKLRFYYYKSN
ncbi:MAG: hypothetical protein IB618_03845 [Candidatus Pacearchaeota archaeon]|nr:MAG: hypothetical protein IB618_03845 [Candidatus Pacearchaeota archaeon]